MSNVKKVLNPNNQC